MTYEPVDDDLDLADDVRPVHGASQGGEGGVALLVTAGAPRLVLTGEIDVSLAPEFTEAADEALTHQRPVVVDARRVTFMDSSGVSMLARLAMLAPDRVTLLDPPEMVRLLLEVTRLDQVLEISRSDGRGPGPTDGSADSAAPRPEAPR